MINSIILAVLGTIQIYLIGYTVYHFLLKDRFGVHLLLVPFSFIFGCLFLIFTSTTLLFINHLEFIKALTSIISLVGGILFILDIKHLKPLQSKNRDDIILLLLITTFLIILLMPNFTSPINGWDSVAIWNIKAKAFSLSSGFQNPLYINPEFVYSHKDYPIGFSLLMSYFYRIDTTFIEYVIKYFLIQIPLNLCITLIYTTKKIFGLTNFWSLTLLPILFTGFAFLGNAISGYADIFISLCIVLSISLMILSKVLSVKSLLYFSIFPAILGALTKNEGLPFLILTLALITLYAIIENKSSLAKIKTIDRSKISKMIANNKRCFRTVIIVCLATLPLIIWIIIKNNEAYSSDLFGQQLTLSFLFSRIKTIALAFIGYIADYKTMGVLFTISTPTFLGLFVINIIKKNTLATLINAIVILQIMAYIAVYLITPYDLSWHLETSLERIFLQFEFALILASFYGIKLFYDQSLAVFLRKFDKKPN